MAFAYAGGSVFADHPTKNLEEFPRFSVEPVPVSAGLGRRSSTERAREINKSLTLHSKLNFSSSITGGLVKTSEVPIKNAAYYAAASFSTENRTGPEQPTITERLIVVPPGFVVAINQGVDQVEASDGKALKEKQEVAHWITQSRSWSGDKTLVTGGFHVIKSEQFSVGLPVSGPTILTATASVEDLGQSNKGPLFKNQQDSSDNVAVNANSSSLVSNEKAAEVRQQVLDFVLNHPDVVRQQNSLILAGWRVKEAESRSSSKLSFFTTGKYPIADNVVESQLRADNLNRTYIDGNLQLSKPVFDGGRREFNKQSAVQRRFIEKLLFFETFERQLSRFLSLLIELSRDTAEVQSVTADLAFIDSSLASIRRRYEMGVGILDDVRRLELQRLDLERTLEAGQRQAQFKRDQLSSEFGFTQIDHNAVLVVVTPLHTSLNPLEVSLLDSFANQISQLEQIALEMDRQSVRAERFPELTVTLNGVLYDLSVNPLDEYELYGGLSMNLPLFDGGERDARIEGIEVQKTIERSTLKKSLSDLQSNWDQTEVEFNELVSQSISNEKRLQSIIDRLEELKIRAKTIESGLIEVTQTELKRRSVARELALSRLTKIRLEIRKAELSGRLMEIIGIEPSIQ